MFHGYFTQIASREALLSFAASPDQGNLVNLFVAVLAILALAHLLVGTGFFFLRAKRYPLLPGKISSRQARRGRGNMSVFASVLLIVPTITLLFVWFRANVPASTSAALSTPSRVATKPSVLPTPTPTSIARLVTTDLVRPGTLTVGSTMTSPPQTYFDKQKKTGFDIDLITAMAQDLGLKVNVVKKPYNDLIPSLNNKSIDVVISAYPITDDIKSSVQYISYLHPSETVLVSSNNPAKLNFTQITDLCGHRVGVLTNSSEDKTLHSTSEQCLSGKIDIIETNDVNNVAELLINKSVDATYQDSPTMNYFLSQEKYKGKIEPLGTFLPGQEEGILIRSDNVAVYNALQSAFDHLVQNKTYYKLLDKWKMGQEAITPPTPTAST